jgi:hypothetical protein
MDNNSVSGNHTLPPATLGNIAQQQGIGGASQTSGFMQFVQVNHPRCECHDCTQIRWKTSMQGQLQGAMRG